MEREELADPKYASRQGRLLYADEVDALMLPWLLDNGKVDIFKAGQEHGLGFSFVSTMQDLLEMEQLEHRGYFAEIDHPVAGTLRYPGPPISPHSPIQPWVYRRAPLLGEHTTQVLTGELGYSPTQVEKWQADGVI